MANATELKKIIFPDGGSYLWGALAGQGNATKRQAVMAALGEKLPKSKCGYNFVIARLEQAANVTNGCRKDCEDQLIAWLNADIESVK